MNHSSTTIFTHFLTILFLLIATQITEAACPKPGNLDEANITATSALLSWDNVSKAVYYELRYKDSGPGTWIMITVFDNSYNLQGLMGSTTYKWQVRSFCSGGNSRWSKASNFTTTGDCPTPTPFTPLGVGSHQATLVWSNESGTAISYDVRYKEISDPNWIEITGIPTNLKIITGLDPLTTYEYQVRSNCASGSSPYSFSVEFTTPENVCTAPQNLSLVAVGEDFATLTWGAVGGAEHYTVRYREVGTTEYLFNDFIFSTTTTLQNLFPGTTYESQVRVECTLGTTDWSDILIFTTDQISQCAVPGNINSSMITATSAKHSWDAVTGGIQYTMRRRIAGTGSWSFQITTTETSVTTFGLTPNTTYEFQVQAYCNIGDSDFSTSVFYTTLDDPPCETPQNLFVDDITPTSATFHWDPVSVVIHYILEYRPQGFSKWTSVTTTGTLISRTGLTPATVYEWRVGVLCTSGGTVTYTGIETFMTADENQCTTPSGLLVLGIQATQATLIWGSIPEAADYDVRIRPTGSSNWTNYPGVGTNLLVVFGLTPSTEYEWQVRSNCSTGSSAYSPSDLFTTTSSLRTSHHGSLISEVEVEQRIYPNPAHDFIEIEWQGFDVAKVQIQMFDGLGRIMASKKWAQSNGLNRQHFDLSWAGSGIYRITLASNGQLIFSETVLIDR
ncbi:MAG: fibronectin type III domain-containing protein [Saprospiraceae bacterium]|nr:fibronectin type III domain-containing protein [Saprospiraceae bacterium]